MRGSVPYDLAFLKDLRPETAIGVTCRRCQRHAFLRVVDVLRFYGELMPLPALPAKLRCTSCRAKGDVDLDATAALRRERRSVPADASIGPEPSPASSV